MNSEVVPNIKFYFAASIRGGRGDIEIYTQFITLLSTYGTVLTEHVGDSSLTEAGEESTDQYIFERDCRWIQEADIIVAEVSNPSLGVGFEIRLAQSQGKRIICFYRKNSEKKLSAMIAGNDYLTIFVYETIDDVKNFLDSQFSNVTS